MLNSIAYTRTKDSQLQIGLNILPLTRIKSNNINYETGELSYLANCKENSSVYRKHTSIEINNCQAKKNASLPLADAVLH